MAALTAALLSGWCGAALGQQPQIARPQPYQVVQRVGYDPAKAQVNHPGGPHLGAANVTIQATFAQVPAEQYEYRLILLPGGNGENTDWAPLELKRGADDKVQGSAVIAAGGWYRLEIRQRAGNRVVSTAQVEPIGVGEVFLIAGQSYAAGHNDELQRVADPMERVTAYDPVKKSWQVAHDPQPNVGDGGTIWPPLGDILVPLLRVPVGMVNVAVAGTSSKQWLPETELFAQAAEAGHDLGQFRFVFWQQGESDVIDKVPTETYVKNLSAIRQSLATAWEFDPPWLLAKSTLHPQVYNDPEGEERIRQAIDQLWREPGFRPGPDTDVLGGENRGGPGSRRHFSRLGQRRAAQLWFASVWRELHHPTELDAPRSQ